AAGVTVEFLAIDSEQQAMDQFPDGDLRAGVPLVSLVADETGTVTLPPFRLAAFVRARSGEARGRAFVIATNPDDPVLALRRAVLVRVVDSAKIPQAGVPVALVSDGIYPLAKAETGSDGLAVLVRDPSFAGRQRRREPGKENGSVTLAIP